MTIKEFDEWDLSNPAYDFIKKLVEEGMTYDQARQVWAEPFCPVCGMERFGEWEMLHELHKHYPGEGK